MNPDNRAIAVSIGRPGPRAEKTELALAHPAGYHTPLIDIHEGPDGLVLEADLPGVAESQLSIQIEDNVLSLIARVDAPAPEGARALHEEYRPADFYRSFILSDEVERSKITAELKNGVLRLTLPKAERSKTRRIEIKTS